ncbi:MAG: hypothetical protein K9N51_05405 [Candidatus Pacebacteria bacterium]|nr:hypothetical protein [Candidatus Paceibacterota bacterium]
MNPDDPAFTQKLADATTFLESPCLPDIETPMSRRYMTLLQAWVPFALEYFEEWPVRPNCGHFFGGVLWYGSETIHPLFVLAAVMSSPEYNPDVTGHSRDDLAAIAIKALRYACFTHDTGPADCVRPEKGLGPEHLGGTKWGERGQGFFRESQCGRNVAHLVLTAVILRRWIDEETWMMVAAVCADYLGRFADMPPKSGIYNDTQAEENAWTALGLTAARLFLQRDPSAGMWEQAARRWMFRAATAPQDMQDHRIVDGDKSIAEWCGRTFTLLPDFMAENHGMVHPTYTAAAIGLTGCTANLYRMFGEHEPEQCAWHHRREIYENLKRLADPYGMYHPVQGMDWPYIIPSGLSFVHGFARLYLNDPDAAHYENTALTLMEKLFQGNNGRMYDPDIIAYCRNQQDHMLLWESRIFSLANIYFAHRLCAAQPNAQPTPPTQLADKYSGVKTYPHSGFVFHRHASGQTSFSWRNEIMALPLTREGLLTIAPSLGSVLGKIQVAEFAASQRVEFVNVNDRESGFAAVMRVLLHDESIQQDVLLASLPDGRLVCREHFRALKPCTVERVAQGFLEIMNETFAELKTNCVGHRTLYTPESEYTFPSVVKPTADEDKTVEFQSPGWLNIDDRMGLVIASSEHRSRYHNRHFFKPYRAVSDELFLNLREEPRCYAEGDSIADIEFMLCPEQEHRATAAETLMPAVDSPAGGWGILANRTLVAGSFDAPSGPLSLTFPRGEDVPVFPGTTQLRKDRVVYETDLPKGHGTYFEPLAFIRTDETVSMAAMPNGQLYATNSESRQASVSLDRRSIKKSFSVKPGETVLL